MNKIVKPLIVSTFSTDSKVGQRTDVHGHEETDFILEINAGERSGGTDLLVGKRSRSHLFEQVIIPHLEKNVFDKKIDVQYVSGTETGGKNVWSNISDTYSGGHPTCPTVIIPGYCGHKGVTGGELKYAKGFSQTTLSNEEYFVNGMLENKNLMNKMADFSGISAPRTESYKTSYNVENIQKTINQICTDFSHHDTVVIKPANAAQGQGVIILPQENLKESLQYLLKDIHQDGNQKRFSKDGWAEKFWHRSRGETSFQIQGYVEAVPFEHKGNQWNTTKRMFWSAVIGLDAQDNIVTDIKCYGGFRKLPREPLSADKSLTSEASISFSYPHSYAEKFKRALKLTPAGSGEKVLIKEDEIPKHSQAMKEDLEALFHSAFFEMPEEQFKVLVNGCAPLTDKEKKDIIDSRQAINEEYHKHKPKPEYNIPAIS